ncbi:MAG: hypothetical protein FDX18_08850 [Chlorobium sp.]|nr:MAG: hypothetical protein FDX18_08850 [Chlorobium sp.]
MKRLKLSTIGQYYTYKEESLLPLLITNAGYTITWTDPADCDLLIIGKPVNPVKLLLKNGWVLIFPDQIHHFINKYINDRHYKPLTLFHTCENLRHDCVKSDYSISFDFSEEKKRHYRLPYWMEMVDWSHEGLVGNKNKRFGRLFSIDKMMQPLGHDFLSKPQKAVIFASHLSEPRKSFYNAVKKVIEIDGFGKYFDRNITNHSSSGFVKYDILREYSFNLCPENKLYPGYYTEKVPEAFLGGTLPVTWTDKNVGVDFNPKAFINLEQIEWRNADVLREILHSKKQLEAYAEQPLILTAPSIEPFREFIRNVLLNAI